MRTRCSTSILLAVALVLSACGDDSGDYHSYGNNYNNYSYNSNNSGYQGNNNQVYPLVPQTNPAEPEVCRDATTSPVTLYMSADDSNSQAQPVYARRMIELGYGGYLRYQAAREYEYLNYYSFDYVPAAEGALDIVPELRFRADLGEYSLLVGVVSPYVELAERRPWNLVFSADTSGSMSGAPLEHSKDIMRTLTARMREGDIVSIVNWGDYQDVPLAAHVVSGPSDPHVVSVINGLQSTGSTDLYSGLMTAYDLANQNYSPERLNRVILISDGGANTGITEDTLIGAEAAKAEGDGIFLVGVGTSDEYNHDLMDHVTDLGKGAYLYVPDAAEAERVFGPDRLLANLEVAALNVQLAVTLPPQFVLSVFHGEEVSTNPTEVKEQHLAPNDQMLYHSLLVYCGVGEPEDASMTFRVTWTDPFTRTPRVKDITVPVATLLAAPADHLEKAELLVDYARLLVNADALDSTGWETMKAQVLERIVGYEARTADPEADEVHTTVSACNYKY